MEKRIYRTRIRGGFMKMRLTTPVAAQGAWLIAGRSAAGAVLLALTVSACTGGGSTVPSIFTPTPHDERALVDRRRHPHPVAHRRGLKSVQSASEQRHRAARGGASASTRPPRRAQPHTSSRSASSSASAQARRRGGRPGPRPAAAVAHAAVPDGRAGDRRRRHGGPAGRRAVRGRRRGGPRRSRHPRLPQAPHPQVRHRPPSPADPATGDPAEPLARAPGEPRPPRLAACRASYQVHHGPRRPIASRSAPWPEAEHVNFVLGVKKARVKRALFTRCAKFSGCTESSC